MNGRSIIPALRPADLGAVSGAWQPLTYGVDALRAVLVGAPTYPLAFDLGALAVSAVAMVSAGARLFERVEAV